MATKWTQKTILIKLKELHPTLDFSNFIYKTVNDKSIIICPVHGPREMKVMNLLRGNSCNLCRPQSQKQSYTQVISKFKKVHSDRYIYSNFEYLNQYQNIIIICKEHGPFTQQILHHTNGSGCEKCHDRSFNRKDLETHIDTIPEYQKSHYEYLNIHYNYLNSISTFLEIKCKKRNHIFFQNLSNHKYGSGCPDCNNIDNQSKGISRICNFLNSLNINYILEKTFIDCKNPKSNYNLYYDIFIEELNCCIEFDGQQHFKPVDIFGGEKAFEKMKFRDQIKNNYCLKNNIYLIRIKYNEDIEKVLKERLKIMSVNKIKIEKKTSYNPDSVETLNDRRIFGGNPDGMINFTRMKYQWALNLWDTMEANTWFPREIQMTADVKDYKFLSEPEKRMYDLVLSQLIFMDSCFKPGTEVLTENGWEKIEDIKENTKIYQFDIKTKEINMDYPLRVIKKPFNDNIITLYNDYNNFLHESTFDHDILIRDNISEYGESNILNPIKKIKVSNLKVRTNRSFIRSGIKVEGFNEVTPHQKLLIAFQADGWLGYKSKNYTTIYFDLVKEYKINNLKLILEELEYEYKTTLQRSPERTRFTIKIKHDHQLSKTFNWIDFNNVNIDWVKLFINEIIKWDSSEINGQYIYRTKIKENCDIVQILFTFVNLSHNYNYTRDGLHCIKWRMDQNILENTGYKNSGKIKIKEETYNGLVYCFSMPKGTLIIRQNNNVTITGNCQTNNLMDNINPYITAPEINACLARQSYEEANHSKSYAVMVESISENTDEIYDMWKNDAKLREKNTYIANVYKDLSGEITDTKILLALFANQILEGLYFYAGFAAVYALGKSGKMLGSSQMIRFIQRDEVTHLLLFQNMINSVRKERPELFTAELEETVRGMFRKAVELESAWGIYITQGQILGFTDGIITQYIQYLADKRLEAVGYKAEYKVSHPIPWVDGYSSFNDQRTNFFEGNVVNYSKGSIDFDDF